MNLRDKNVLLTGGSSGIGLAISKALDEKGAKVFSLDQNVPHETSLNIQHFSVDVTKAEQIRFALKKLNIKFDILINNAGIMRRGTILESSEEEFDALFSVNVKGSWLVLKESQNYLVDEPIIIQMSSRHGISLPTNPALYALTKHVLIALSEILAKTYPKYQVKLVCPGPVDTPLGRFGVSGKALEEKIKIMHKPEELAQKIIKLLEEDKNKLIFDEESWNYYFE